MAALGCGLGLCLRWRMLLGWDREANSAPAAPPMRPAGRRWIADRRLAAGRLLAGRGFPGAAVRGGLSGRLVFCSRVWGDLYWVALAAFTRGGAVAVGVSVQCGQWDQLLYMGSHVA